MSLRTILRPLSLSLTLAHVFALAAPTPLELNHALDLSDFQGMTFLEAMTAEGGIKEALDQDYSSSYKIADWETVRAALDNFDSKIRRKVLRSFSNGERGLQALVNSLEGQSFTPANIVGRVRRELRGGDVFAVSQLLAMASGAGTLILVDNENYYYNYGYKSGENPDDVKSGRSFGAGVEHNANDASDVFYLTELENYLESTPNPKLFYRTMMQVLTQCDTTGFYNNKMSDLGETTLTDFIAIYTAESDRHIMVDLHPVRHPWENDLAEVTFLSAFSSVEGRIMTEDTLSTGNLREYWAKSSVSNRSGIGITRKGRRKLQRLISNFEREHNPSVVEAVEDILGRYNRRDGDLFRSVMEYLNNYNTQDHVTRNAEALTEAFVDFLIQIRADAADIAAEIDARN